MLKVRVGSPVAAHLFSVAAGLDSMVVGEAEINGQVARAFRDAQAAGTTSAAINLLFQSAARTAKQVATVTGLGAAGRSVASVALDIANDSADLRGARALVIGTGAYARVVAAELRSRGCTDLSVFSPSGRATGFATGTTPCRSVPTAWPTRWPPPTWSSRAAAPAPTCSTRRLLNAAVSRRDNPLPVIDLALRSDVSAAARAVPGVRLIDLHTVAQLADPAHL